MWDLVPSTGEVTTNWIRWKRESCSLPHLYSLYEQK